MLDGFWKLHVVRFFHVYAFTKAFAKKYIITMHARLEPHSDLPLVLHSANFGLFKSMVAIDHSQ